MGEVAKLIGKFFTRDFLYIIGGTSIIVSILYLVDQLPENFKNYELAAIVSIGYVIGYLNQEFYSMIHIVTMSSPSRPNKFIIFLFERFTLRKFETEVKNDPRKYYKLISKLDKKLSSELDRIINLKQIGTTVGTSWLTTSLLWIFIVICDPKPIEIAIMSVSLVSSIILICLAWVKTLQQMEFIEIMKSKKKIG